jgi:transcriptional regulator with XRE-family HTH domain
MIGLEYFRRRNNMSITDLGNQIGVSRQIVSKWEKKEKSIPTDRVREFAKLFQVNELYITQDIEDYNYNGVPIEDIIAENMELKMEIKILKEKLNMK